MDYTLAIYKNPEYDQLTYSLIIEDLITHSAYPPAIASLKFDPHTFVRGLILDMELGNVLKLDKFTSILVCYHGKTKLTKAQISDLYPSFRIPNDLLGSKRFEILNVTYSLPISVLWCDLISFFESSPTPQKLDYQSLLMDVWNSSQKLHNFVDGQLKSQNFIDQIHNYVSDGKDLALVLKKLIDSGKKLFLLTNSPWMYTDKVMNWLLDNKLPQYSSWRNYFDVIIVEAQKPNFFTSSNHFREISLETNHPKITHFGELAPGMPYQGGNMNLLNKLCNITSSHDVLYVGDHIFSDVMISKKKHSWRTLLIMPELQEELINQKKNQDLFLKLVELDNTKKQLLEDFDIENKNFEEIQTKLKDIKAKIKAASDDYDSKCNPYYGSPFRSGLHLSFFSMQLGRYADLYSCSVLSLLNYSPHHAFYPPISSLPHERE
uniref:5'-nucleotidase n=1 Tax=Arcella intermedia TaxID=1963864 RepID=A0A6B2L3V0_9EUKA